MDWDEERDGLECQCQVQKYYIGGILEVKLIMAVKRLIIFSIRAGKERINFIVQK